MSSLEPEKKEEGAEGAEGAEGEEKKVVELDKHGNVLMHAVTEIAPTEWVVYYIEDDKTDPEKIIEDAVKKIPFDNQAEAQEKYDEAADKHKGKILYEFPNVLKRQGEQEWLDKLIDQARKDYEIDLTELRRNKNKEGVAERQNLDPDQFEGVKNDKGEQWVEDDDSSVDVVHMLDVYDEGIDLLERLGIRPRPPRNTFDPANMNEQQKQDYEEEMEFRKKSKLESERIIAAALKDLNDTRIKCDEAKAELVELKAANVQKKLDVIHEKAQVGVIEEAHKQKIIDFRRARLGEIYWIMVESHDSNTEDKDNYHYLIHNYLMQLFLEDFDEETLDEDFKRKQKQIHRNFEKQFNKIVDPIRKDEKPAKSFKKLFPKPVAKGEGKEEFEQMYQIYEDWVTKKFNGDEDEQNADIFDSVGASDFSAVDSQNQNSAFGNEAEEGDADKPKVDKAVDPNAIKEENEDEV